MVCCLFYQIKLLVDSSCDDYDSTLKDSLCDDYDKTLKPEIPRDDSNVTSPDSDFSENTDSDTYSCNFERNVEGGTLTRSVSGKHCNSFSFLFQMTMWSCSEGSLNIKIHLIFF